MPHAGTRAGTSFLHPHHVSYLRAARFFRAGTGDGEEIGVSPRGNEAGEIEILDHETIAWPEWNDNNRISTLRHLAQDPRIGLLFLFPGHGVVTRRDDLRQRFERNGRQPKVVIVMTVDKAFFHCGRAISRSRLWDAAAHDECRNLPSLGAVLKDLANLRDITTEQIDTMHARICG